MAYALRSSHEEINRWHRVLGRITYFLLCLHGAFYLNYYIQTGVFIARLTTSSVAILGFTALLSITLLTTTALGFIRQYSYRIFFITHLMVALALPPLIYFHVHHARVYMVESLVVFLVDLAARKLTTTTAPATLEAIHGTNLIKITAKVPEKFISRFRDFPGSHVYMSIPVASRSGSLQILYEFMFNPFTVAAVDESSQELSLVARQLNGPLSRRLGALADISATQVQVPLCIEGPYGSSKHFSELMGHHADRVLLVAGGVGATFIVPIYQYITSEKPSARADLVWAVHEAGEAIWASSGTEKSIIDDDRVQLFLTGDAFDSDLGAEIDEVELETLHKDDRRNKHVPNHNANRPDLRKIVDDIFRQGQEDRVAVLVCGPEGMARELRGYVGDWVKRGREVWLHNENFSW